MPENTEKSPSGLKKRKLSRAVVHEVSNVKWPANKRFHLVVKSASAPIATEKADQTVVDATVGTDEDPNMGFSPGDASLLRAIGRALNGLSDDVTIDDVLGVARAVGVTGAGEDEEDEDDDGDEDEGFVGDEMPASNGFSMFKAEAEDDAEEGDEEGSDSEDEDEEASVAEKDSSDEEDDTEEDEEMDVKKGGPGSGPQKGGGQTASGKDVPHAGSKTYRSSGDFQKATAGFTEQDHRDAAEMHQEDSKSHQEAASANAYVAGGMDGEISSRPDGEDQASRSAIASSRHMSAARSMARTNKAAQILPGFEKATKNAETNDWAASGAPDTLNKDARMPKEQSFEALEKSMRLEFNEKIEEVTKAARERVSVLEAQIAREQAARVLKSTHDEVVNDLGNLTFEPMAFAECMKSIRETEATKPHADTLMQVLKAANAQLGAGFGRSNSHVAKSLGHSGSSEGMTASSQLEALIQKSASELSGLSDAQRYKHVVTKTAEGRALAERIAQEKVAN